MPKIGFTESVTLKAGVYAAEVESVDEDEGQYGPQFKFIFGIIEGKQKGAQIFGWASQTLTPKSKLTKWASTLLGEEIGKGYELDTAALVGCACRLVLSVEERADGSETNKITSLLPIDGEDEEEEESEPAQQRAPARQPAAAGNGNRRTPF